MQEWVKRKNQSPGALLDAPILFILVNGVEPGNGITITDGIKTGLKNAFDPAGTDQYVAPVIRNLNIRLLGNALLPGGAAVGF